MMNVIIRQLEPADAGALFGLRQTALLDAPLAFLASPEDDLSSSEEAVRALLRRGPESVVFGAVNERLVGMLGLYRATNRKALHKAYCWGMYVLPESRRHGLGAQLLHAALSYVKTLDGVASLRLSVSETATEAKRLYEKTGFKVWGIEPDALRYQGQSMCEYHLALSLT
jgi:ribosomal protein S18 acetylase RimI-like enzyme